MRRVALSVEVSVLKGVKHSEGRVLEDILSMKHVTGHLIHDQKAVLPVINTNVVCAFFKKLN